LDERRRRVHGGAAGRRAFPPRRNGKRSLPETHEPCFAAFFSNGGCRGRSASTTVTLGA
jgi:hypothetical protein